MLGAGGETLAEYTLRLRAGSGAPSCSLLLQFSLGAAGAANLSVDVADASNSVQLSVSPIEAQLSVAQLEAAVALEAAMARDDAAVAAADEARNTLESTMCAIAAYP